MGSEFRVRELVLGIEGLALLRHAMDADEEFIAARLAEIRSYADDSAATRPDRRKPVSELDAADGYASWSSRYDSLPSAYLEVEEPILHGLLDRGPAGTALDAACGTGRQTAALAARGYRTIGVDQSPEMLAHAHRKAPGAEFREGHLEKLPLDDDSVDLAVCSLALTHLPDLSSGIGELARVVRPGGRVIVSDLHPFVTTLQGQCIFVHDNDRLAFVRNHRHLHSSYLSAFADAGLTVRECHEPVFNGRLAPGGYEESIADAARAAWEGIPLVVIWAAEKPETSAA
ncbi:class I SAM-dependent methyltransferase [Streptomyces sp. GS7]|uniref:class I SAM-dependent methyltransferase n=1 Tax=Streptomyces sp. GS7 TaxID=2692234 RepID=UPI00131874F1|nr:class I SAM-dependent methyltransferase [Streptomyces sp. GS7]QHC21217.1 methyltransferase domain-containing protein [Streptomyces sp. GS7]